MARGSPSSISRRTVLQTGTFAAIAAWSQSRIGGTLPARQVSDLGHMRATTAPLVAKTSDGLNLSVQTYGDVENDEILLIHGFGQSGLSWSKQTSSALTEHYRVVTFDLRGHGNSDKPDHAAAYASGEQWADDLHTVMEAAGLRRPTLVGWSLGGAIIGLYLAKYGRESTAGINLVDALTEKKIEGGVDVAVTPCR